MPQAIYCPVIWRNVDRPESQSELLPLQSRETIRALIRKASVREFSSTSGRSLPELQLHNSGLLER